MITTDGCCICGTVKNCANYLDDVFYNIRKITDSFLDYHIIIYYDESTDATLAQLLKYKKLFKMHIHINKTYKSSYRTHRLAFGRNYCLKMINRYFSHYKYFIMMDFDNVCSNKINISVLHKYIMNNENWDAISFNKNQYYDLWALSIRPYIFSYAHFNNSDKVLRNMSLYIKDKLASLKENELLPCFSAFNGFCLYKTQTFKDCVYDGRIRLDLIPLKYLEETVYKNSSEIVFKDKDWLCSKNEDCEHRSFHFEAIIKKKAKIFISPEILIK
jgi:hypothetical protein